MKEFGRVLMGIALLLWLLCIFVAVTKPASTATYIPPSGVATPTPNPRFTFCPKSCDPRCPEPPTSGGKVSVETYPLPSSTRAPSDADDWLRASPSGVVVAGPGSAGRVDDRLQ